MFRVLPIRFGFIIFIIFFSIYFSFADFKFHWTFTTGICEEYTMFHDEVLEEMGGSRAIPIECAKGKNLKEVPRFGLFLDAPTLLLQLIITFCGSWFRKGNLVNKLERASHLSKDVGEFTAALGAILVFNMPFNEAAISLAFGGVFLSYFWGHFFGIVLITIANYLKTQEENELVTP